MTLKTPLLEDDKISVHLGDISDKDNHACYYKYLQPGLSPLLSGVKNEGFTNIWRGRNVFIALLISFSPPRGGRMPSHIIFKSKSRNLELSVMECTSFCREIFGPRVCIKTL